MNSKIRIGVCGYGNLGGALESEIRKNSDMELTAFFTRRDPGGLRVGSGKPVERADAAAGWKDKIDVMVLCGSSSNDFPAQGLGFAKNFNTVDSFDTHSKIPGYFAEIDAVAKAANTVSVISAGWDPGLFSLLRVYMESIIPNGHSYTFWGKGVSQGHSDAIRRIDGVENAIQYSVPVDAAVVSVRNCENPVLSPREKIKRVCYVAVKRDADKEAITEKIKNMPDYFADYDTTVHFISNDELIREHGRLTHGGNVIRTGETGGDAGGPDGASETGGDAGSASGVDADGARNKQVLEFSLKLDSNPEFTASVMLAYARAAHRLSARGERGARTVADIPPALLSPMSYDDILRTML